MSMVRVITGDEIVEQAADLTSFYDGSPVPAVDDRARLVGVVGTADLARQPSV